MNVITTALNDRPVKNRKLLPHPRSAPVLGRSNVKTPANERLYPMPNDPFSLPLPLSNPPLMRLLIDHQLEDVWRCQTHSFDIVISLRAPSADWFSPGKLVPSPGSRPTFYCEFLLTDCVLLCWTDTHRIEAADVEEIDTVVKLLYLKSGDPIPCRITQRPPNAQEREFIRQEKECIQSERLIASNHALAAALSAARPPLETTVSPALVPPPLAPPELNDTLLWHVQQKIVDELDPKLKSAPSASLMFTRLCRDQSTLAELSRSHQWPLRTLKLRKAALEAFLQAHFHLRVADFYVDRSMFRAAERQLSDHRARRLSPHALADSADPKMRIKMLCASVPQWFQTLHLRTFAPLR